MMEGDLSRKFVFRVALALCCVVVVRAWCLAQAPLHRRMTAAKAEVADFCQRDRGLAAFGACTPDLPGRNCLD